MRRKRLRSPATCSCSPFPWKRDRCGAPFSPAGTAGEGLQPQQSLGCIFGEEQRNEGYLLPDAARHPPG